MCLFTNHCNSNARITALQKLMFVLLCSWFLSPLPRRWRFAIVLFHGFVEDLVIALISEVFHFLSFCLKHSVKCQTILKTKRNHPFTVRNTENSLMTVRVPPYSSKKRYFSCFSLSRTLYNGASKLKYNAYWHMNFSLINGYGTRKNNICFYSFEVALVTSPIL